MTLDQPGLEGRRRRTAILVLACGMAAVVIDGSAPVVALPSIAAKLGVDGASTTLIVALYQMVLVTTLLPFGALGDRLGCRRLYCWGLAAFGVASTLCLFVSTLPQLLALRVFQAVGASAALSMSGALLRSTYPARQLGRGMGIQGSVVSLSIALAPSLGGFILSVAPWPWVFAGAAPFAALALTAYTALPHLAPHTHRFDWLAASICALALALLIGSLQVVAHSNRPILAIGLGVAGAILAFYLVDNQRGKERPIVPVDLLARPALGLSALCALLAFSAWMSVMLTLPFRLEKVYGFDAAMVGLVIVPWPLMIMILAPLAGTLSDKVPAESLGALGLGVAAFGLILIGLLPSGSVAPWNVAWRMAVTGIGVGLFLPSNGRLIAALTPIERATSGSSIISLTRLTGQTFGAAIAAILLGMDLGSSRYPALISAAVAAVAGLVSASRRRFIATDAGQLPKA